MKMSLTQKMKSFLDRTKKMVTGNKAQDQSDKPKHYQDDKPKKTANIHLQ